jgi:hypothetical protein
MAQSLDMAGFEFDAGNAQNPSAGATAVANAPTVAGAVPLSAAAQRFQTCRWRKGPEAGLVDHCTHRDVLPMTGTGGFEADSWCTECGFYKVKRTPRKRQAPEDRYY